MLLSASLVIALLLLVVLYRREHGAGEIYRRPCGVLENGVMDLRAMTLPPQAVVDRIFSAEDLQYSRTLPKRIRVMFTRDRRSLALAWIRQIRQVTVLLMREHGGAVRRNPSLQLWKEVQVAGSFLSLLASCEFLALMVTALGPVRARLFLSSLGARLLSLQAELGSSYLSAYGAA